MAICFNDLIRHGGDAFIWRHRMECHPGLNMGTYNIWDGHGFGLPQAIPSVKQGNYKLMLLTETNIPDMV